MIYVTDSVDACDLSFAQVEGDFVADSASLLFAREVKFSPPTIGKNINQGLRGQSALKIFTPGRVFDIDIYSNRS